MSSDDVIFLIDSSGGLSELVVTPYESESLLQRLLADHPTLLVGSQITPQEPRRWLLVSREVGIPDDVGHGNRWSVDHLFLDQDAIPTLIEVKRASDTRIRREVVGQMLDYAANAILYWPVEEIRRLFEERAVADGEDPGALLAELVRDEVQPEEYWQQVKTNLQAGRIRMVFVADTIPTELQRIIEFLNDQLDPAMVLGVSIQQYTDGDLRTLVPRVIGVTAEAQKRKSAGTAASKRVWTADEFLTELGREHANLVPVARELLAWAKSRELPLWWGQGIAVGSFFPLVPDQRVYRGQHFTFAVWTYGAVEIQFQHMRNRPPFDDRERRLALLQRLNEIPGVELPAESIDRRPSIPMSTLVDPGAREAFLRVWDSHVAQIRGGDGAGSRDG